METTSRPPSSFRVLDGPDNSSMDLGNGAITAPMAVSFREEKLALRTTSLPASDLQDGAPSASAERGRG